MERFRDQSGRLWVWDKTTRKVFQTSPQGVAAAKHFYRVPEFIGTDVDPLFLERDLSTLESRAASLLQECIAALESMEALQAIRMTSEDRSTLSSFIAVQFLRTAEQREVLSLFALANGSYAGALSPQEKVNLHAQMLCSGLVEKLAERIFDSIWMYARNRTATPFWSSDNPVSFKTGDNRMWLKATGIFSPGCYAVYPLSPSYVLYCKERTQWSALSNFDSCLSPVELTDDMVQHENSGQVFMATRHVISNANEFSWANEFVESIGTDTYAPRDG